MSTPGLSAERTILSVVTLGSCVYLIATTSDAHFTAVVALVGPLLGAVVSWWFRLNGTAQEHQDQVALTEASK